MAVASSSKPIRVLQSVSAMNHGGVEHFLMNVYRAIDRSKVQFDFLYRVGARCVFDDEIEALGGRIYRFQSPDAHPVAASRFYASLFKEHPEWSVIHEHRSHTGGFMGVLRAARRSCVSARVVHSHSSAPSSWRGAVGKAFERVTIPYNRSRLGAIATDYFACSDVAARWMYEQSNVGMEQVVVMPNGIDVARFSFDERRRRAARRELGFSDDEIVVGHVGRFSPEKNHLFLLEVFEKLASQLSSQGEPDARLLLVGDGPLFGEVKARAASLGVERQVVFAGLRDDTAPLYCAMDVLCMPSVHEGLPVSCVEAQASGLPLVLSTGVTREADLAGGAEFLDLEAGAEAWACALDQGVCRGRTADRSSGTKAVRESGYDIAQEAQWLQEFYLMKSEEGCR